MTNFDLQKPSYTPEDLDEATTNDGSSIEIEVVDDNQLPVSQGSIPCHVARTFPAWSELLNWGTMARGFLQAPPRTTSQ